MVRQARSEITRRKIIDAAVELFTDVGYASTGLGDIIERVGVTKGALYYHFDSKESLARAIIADGATSLTHSFAGVSSAPAPALENMIHGVFVVADFVRTDKLSRTALQLARTLGEFSDAASEAYTNWLAALSGQAEQAQQQGDLGADMEPGVAAEVVLSAVLGVELIWSATAADDLIGRLTRAWEVLLPAIVTEESLPYFSEYLARESMRHVGPALSINPASGPGA